MCWLRSVFGRLHCTVVHRTAVHGTVVNCVLQCMHYSALQGIEFTAVHALQCTTRHRNHCSACTAVHGEELIAL